MIRRALAVVAAVGLSVSLAACGPRPDRGDVGELDIDIHHHPTKTVTATPRPPAAKPAPPVKPAPVRVVPRSKK